MSEASALTFVRLNDGTVLQREADGGFRPVPTHSDRERLAGLSEQDIDAMAGSDPDHPGLDDALLEEARRSPPNTVELDPDVLDFFQRDGGADRQRVNDVLRHFVEVQKAG